MNFIARKAIELFASALGHSEFLKWCTEAAAVGGPAFDQQFAVQAFRHCERREVDESNPEDSARIAKIIAEASPEIVRIANAVRTGAPKLELRKLKIADFASEDSTCFSAEVWVNGRHAFDASNSGQGGCDHYRPVRDDGGSARMQEALDTLSAFAWTQPPRNVHGIVLYGDVESLIADEIEKAQVAKAVARVVRSMRNRVVMIRDGKIFQTKMRSEGISSAVVQQAVKQFAPAKVLNALPPQEAESLLTEVMSKQECG